MLHERSGKALLQTMRGMPEAGLRFDGIGYFAHQNPVVGSIVGPRRAAVLAFPEHIGAA
jgi:hypothetical protein